jgi:hypothetical protein
MVEDPTAFDEILTFVCIVPHCKFDLYSSYPSPPANTYVLKDEFGFF